MLTESNAVCDRVLIEDSVSYTLLVAAAEGSPSDVDARRRLGQLICARRSAKAMTQVVLAEEVGVHKVTVSRIESGRHPMRPATARQVERALDWKLGACDELLADPEVDPATYEQAIDQHDEISDEQQEIISEDNAPSVAAVSVAMAREFLEMVKSLQPKLLNDPDTRSQMADALGDFEDKLALVVEHEFTRDALKTLMDLNAMRRSLNPES